MPESTVNPPYESAFVVFAADACLAVGDLRTVAEAAKRAIERAGSEPVLIFDARTSHQVEVDFRGSVADVVGRIVLRAETGACPAMAPPTQRGPGRPKLGVVAREVTLLPRHWEWLASQPGGASVTLRKLVDHARRANEGKDRIRQSQDAAYRFMATMAGDRPGFEEATRALFAGDKVGFDERTADWPIDIRNHATNLAAVALGVPASLA